MLRRKLESESADSIIYEKTVGSESRIAIPDLHCYHNHMFRFIQYKLLLTSNDLIIHLSVNPLTDITDSLH